MKMLVSAALLLTALTLPAWAAPDYTSIHLETDVNTSADRAWSKISDYCAAPKIFGSTCVLTGGTGDVGTNRKLNGTTDELMVARTRYSYTYTQPASTILYHGTLAAEPIDATHSKLIFILFYDQAPLATPEAQAANRKQRADRFSGALAKMKALAEGP